MANPQYYSPGIKYREINIDQVMRENHYYASCFEAHINLMVEKSLNTHKKINKPFIKNLNN